MVLDIESVLVMLDPFFETTHTLMTRLEYVFGGIFGLYLILTYLKWRESRKDIEILKDINHNLRALNRHFGVKTTHRKKTEKAAKIKHFLKEVFKR